MRAERALPIVLRVIGASFVVFFTLGLISSAARIEAPDPLRALVQWDELGNAEEQMLSIVYVVWGAFLWFAARDPLRHRMFIDFTLIANAAHFLLMFVQGIAIDGEHAHLVGDVPTGIGLVGVLAATWLPVRRRATVSS
jgi:hypothetical protein